MPPDPLYTPANCKFAYQLRWSLTLFWNSPPLFDDWLPELRKATAKDGVRILRHRITRDDCSQFLLSTRPATKPSTVIWSVKGRLQTLVRAEMSQAFQRNYDLLSIGSTRLEKAEAYVAAQLRQHSTEARPAPAAFEDLQFVDPEIDLSRPRFTNHGRFSCNLHLVFIRAGRSPETRPAVWLAVRNMIRKASRQKQHLLSRLGILPDHVHMTVGIHPDESPEEVALSYMNNIAFCLGMEPVLMHGCFIGGIGNYDLHVIDHHR